MSERSHKIKITQFIFDFRRKYKPYLRDGLTPSKVQELFYLAYLLLVHLINFNKEKKSESDLENRGFSTSQVIGSVVKLFIRALFLYLRDRVMDSAIGLTVRKMLNVMVPWSILPFKSDAINFIFLTGALFALTWYSTK